MKQLLKKPVFWIGLIITSLASGYIAYNLFDDAFAIMHIDLKMDRDQALKKAEEICKAQNIGPQEHDSAINFATDQNAQTFIELAGGGKEVLFSLIDEDIYQPHTWQVRHFKEYEEHEATVFFKPDGTPYGFTEIINEELTGAALSKDEALAIAQKEAQAHWNVSFENYSLLESSQETKLSGRVDHIFTYEHTTQLEEGRLRLLLQVSGDRLTQVKHFVHVPESFTRNYANMRSANNTIAWLAYLIMQLLYMLGGCVMGIMLLSKKRYVQYKSALIASVILSSLLILVQINNIPLMWNGYMTAIGKNIFFMQFILRLLISFFTSTLFFSIIFAGAESLTRKAFGTHPQLWRIFSADAAATGYTRAVTLLGYLIVPILLCFVTLFYYGATTYLGWWLPSSALINPNVLATYAPWLSSLVMSLQAGFVEECLFRAVPLSCAALIGKKYGNKNKWIFFAFVLQIIVFAAAHANYPAQPAYARVIELIFPSTVFGLIYLFLGLLPAIIAHVIFDVVWFALPIFSSSAPSAFLNQIMIVLGSTIPLFILAYARLKKGTWSDLSPTFLNNAWNPPADTNDAQLFRPLIATETTLRTHIKCISGTLGVIALLAFAYFVPKTHDAVPLEESRNEVSSFTQDLFTQEVTDQNVWTQMTRQQNDKPIMASHRFVWQELGNSAYKKLLGNYVPESQWQVRYVQFNGDLLARAEEYRYFIANNRVRQLMHILPEHAEGATLSEDNARSLALNVLQERFSLDAQNLEEISAQSHQKPNRLDWTFIFKDKKYPFMQGQARNVVYISGDQVTNAYQTMHIPQEWQRKELERNSIAGTLRMLNFMSVITVTLLGATIAWYIGGTFAIGSFILLALLIALMLLFMLANQLPDLFIFFNTSEQFVVQLLRSLVGSVISSLGMGISIAYLITLARSYTIERRLARSGMHYYLGLSFGFVIAAAQVVIAYGIEKVQPHWPDLYMLNKYLPSFAVVSEVLDNYLFATLFVSLFMVCIHFITQRFFKLHPMTTLPLFMLFVLCMFGMIATYNTTLLFATGSICGLILWSTYYFIITYDFALVPAMTAGYLLLQLARQIIFGNFVISHIVAGVLITLISSVWYKKY